MKPLSMYYLSRLLIVLVISLIFAWSGLPWWMAALVFALAGGFFLWAPHSGRYRVKLETQATPLRLDERSRQVRNRAGRNAFLVVEMLTLIAFTYGQFQNPPAISTAVIGAILGIGMLTYLAMIFAYEKSPVGE